MLKALLTNIQVLAKSSKKQVITKEPYFERQWGNQAAFKKTIDRSVYTLDSQDQSSQIHEQILVLHKTKAAQATSICGARTDFLSRMAVDSLDFIKQQRERMVKAKQEEQLCHNSMAAMTEHIFEILKSYSYELNNTLGYGPLHIAATNPQAVTEITKFNSLRQAEESITYYRGRLSTPSFSLILRGDKSGVQFFIIPVSRTLGLSKQESNFSPVMRLSTRMVDGEVAWQTEKGSPLTSSMVEVICMNLFQRLIEETKSLVNTQENTTTEAAECAS